MFLFINLHHLLPLVWSKIRNKKVFDFMGK